MSGTAVLTVGQRRIPVIADQTVFELLRAGGTAPGSACGGAGRCGLCRISITRGRVSPPTEPEVRSLGSAALAEGYRLACQVRPLGNVHISLPHALPETIWSRMAEREYFNPDGGALSAWPAGAEGYGVALDMGTTQIRLSLLDLVSGRRVGGLCGLNPQRIFGSDVLTRLEAAAGSEEAAERMSRIVTAAIREALGLLTEAAGIDRTVIRKMALVGNTAMLSLLLEADCGLLLDPDSWMRPIDSLPPAAPQLNRAFGLSDDAQVEVIKPLAGFVGSDLLAGLLACSAANGTEGTLLIDFGTNSEIALWDGSAVWVTSAAGGPAFEGSGISCGMPASAGAICNADMLQDCDAFVLSVLGDSPPRGLCGSGLVDILAGLLRCGLLKQHGRLAPFLQREGFIIDKAGAPIAVKDSDVDMFQRAKAAIGAGVLCLLEKAGMSMTQLSHLYVCGAFGRHLNIGHAQLLGLLPALEPRRCVPAGNTALAGAELLLAGGAAHAEIERIRELCRIVNLSSLPEFEELFIDNLYLRPVAEGSSVMQSG